MPRTCCMVLPSVSHDQDVNKRNMRDLWTYFTHAAEINAAITVSCVFKVSIPED